MATHLKHHAKNIVDALYDLLFDSSRAYHDPSPYATVCVKPYANGEDSCSGSFGFGASGYASIVRDKVAAAASSASSAAASLTSHPRLHQPAAISEALQQLTDPAFWHRFSPAAAWDHFIEERAPYLHELRSHLGWEHLTRLAERWGVEPRIVILVMLLPVILLLLSSCVFMGAGHTADDGPPAYQGGGRGKKADPNQAGHRHVNGASSSSSSKQSNGSSGASSSGSGKGGKSRHGSKKGGAQDRNPDNTESSKTHAGVPKGVVGDGGSKATMLGSAGFRGAELQHFKPIDIYAAMGMAQPVNRKPSGHGIAKVNRGAEDGISAKRNSSQSKKAEIPLRHGNSQHDDSLVSSIMEDVVGPSDSQQEQVEIDLDNQEDYEDNVLEDSVPITKAGGVKSAVDSARKNSKAGRKSDPHAKLGNGGSPLSSLDSESSAKKSQGLKESDLLQSHAPVQDHTDRQGAGPAGPGSEFSASPSAPLSRTRVPRAHSFKEADRHRHQPHISSRASKNHLFGHHPTENEVDAKDRRVSPLAFKIMDFAQRNTVMKSLDAVSGGVLGATMATVAAGTAIAESSTNAWKGDFTTALDDLASNLKDSFDQVMIEGGLEGSGLDQDDNWDLRSMAPQLNIASQRPVSMARKFSVEDISVGPRTKYAIYVDPPQRSEVQGPDPEAPVNHDSKESDEDVKILDYQSYKKSTGKTTKNKGNKNPTDKSATGIDWGNAKVKATETNPASGVDWGETASEASSLKDSEPAQSSESLAKSQEQKSKSAAKQSSKKAAQRPGPAVATGTSAKEALDSAIKTSRVKLAAAVDNLHVRKDRADTQAHAAAQDSKAAVESAQGSIKKTASDARHDVKATIRHAEDKALKAVSDAKRAVDSAHASAEKAIDTAAQIMEASARAVDGSAKAIGEDMRTTVRETKRKARSARKAARKAKNAMVKNVTDFEKKIEQDTEHVTHKAHDALRVSKETVNSATGITQYAKDTVIGLAGNVAHGAVHQARAAMDSVVGTTKRTLWNNVVEPVMHVEHMVESAVEIGLGTVDAAIQGAREAAEKLNQDTIAAAQGTQTAPYASGVNAKRSENLDRHDMDGKPGVQRASDHASATASTPGNGDQTAQEDKAAYTQKTPISKKARRKAAKRQEMASAAQATSTDTQADVENSKDSSSQPLTKADSSRDLLSSAKHYAGGLGDAASELVHAAQIAAQTLTLAKDHTSAFIGAASNDIQAVLSGPGHDHHELHDELRDIKNEFKQKIHFRGISSSTSSAAKKADLVAQDYYNSLPKPEGGSATARSLDSADSSHRRLAASESKSRSKKPAKSATLDHEEYVFKDKDGNEVPVTDVDEAGSDSEESSGSDDDKHDRHSRLGTLIFQAPGILHSAKAAATAMAARVADVSYENFDLAKHSLSEMVDNLTENLAGHEERDTPSEDDSESDDQRRDGGAGKVRGSVQQKNTQEPRVQHKSQLRPSAAPHGKVALSRSADKVVSFFPSAVSSHIHFQDHAYKPNRNSHHVDKDGFIIVEDPQLEHKHGLAAQTETQQAKDILHVPKAHPTAQHQGQPKHHVDTPTMLNPSGTTVPSMTTPRNRRVNLQAHPASGVLSYSAAVKMNVEEGDHGPLVGRTESHEPSHQHQHSLPISGTDSLFQNQDIYEEYDQVQPLQQEYTLDHHGKKAPLVREARRDSGFDLLM
ncbi:hypothetical protein BGZ72_004246 [Mortierella alpina]|nr:hypothetical protein BGZ72_004246 [Mortierella alpina]